MQDLIVGWTAMRSAREVTETGEADLRTLLPEDERQSNVFETRIPREKFT